MTIDKPKMCLTDGNIVKIGKILYWNWILGMINNTKTLVTKNIETKLLINSYVERPLLIGRETRSGEREIPGEILSSFSLHLEAEVTDEIK